jgi:hypothetical protein
VPHRDNILSYKQIFPGLDAYLIEKVVCLSTSVVTMAIDVTGNHDSTV